MRTGLALLLAASALATASPPAAGEPVLGIGDQIPEALEEPLFRSLDVPITRVVAPWDAVERDAAWLERWLAAAEAIGARPLVAFGHSSSVRRRYPWVRDVSPWNEANHSSQPTFRHPRRAAEYYNVVRRRCPRCRIVAADLLDSRNMLRWLRVFRRHADGRPRLWGLHNYRDANRFVADGTDRLLAAVPGTVWLTETGGVVTHSGATVLEYDEERAAASLRHLLRLVHGRPRIRRVYLYQWRAIPPNPFDAGLLRPNGTRRPGFYVVRRAIRRLNRIRH